MTIERALITPTSNAVLERALQDKLHQRSEAAGSLGELEPLAIRLGLMQNTLKPRFREPQLAIFASDHGLAVDGVTPATQQPTQDLVSQLLRGVLPLSAFARSQQIDMTVIDCGIAAAVVPHERLLTRKIAHGTRNTRVSAAMSLDQAHAAIRAGMEIGDTLRGNVLMCAGVGVGSHQSAALVLARLGENIVRELLFSGPHMPAEELAHQLGLAHGAQARHKEANDPVEVMAAFGGFEMAVMVGVILVAASKRHLVMVDGMPACAALMVAQRIAPACVDYSVFCRSRLHQGLDHAMQMFRATALLELGLDSTDGTGAVLAWPLVRSSAALLTEVADGADPGPSMPVPLAAAPGAATP